MLKLNIYEHLQTWIIYHATNCRTDTLHAACRPGFYANLRKTHMSLFTRKKKTLTGPADHTPLLQHWQSIVILLLVYDVIAVNLSYFLALWIRFDCIYSHIPPNYLDGWKLYAPVHTMISIFVFWVLRLYSSLWRFASYTELPPQYPP